MVLVGGGVGGVAFWLCLTYFQAKSVKSLPPEVLKAYELCDMHNVSTLMAMFTTH